MVLCADCECHCLNVQENRARNDPRVHDTMQWMIADVAVASLEAIGIDSTFLKLFNSALESPDTIAPGDIDPIVRKCPKEDIIQDQHKIDHACLFLPLPQQLEVKRLYAKTKNIQLVDETDTEYQEQMQSYEFDLAMLQSYLILAEELNTNNAQAQSTTSTQNIIWHRGEYVEILLVEEPDKEGSGETKARNKVHMFGTVVRSATIPNQLEVQSSHYPAQHLDLESNEFEFRRASECLLFQQCTDLQNTVYGDHDENVIVSLYLNQIVTDSKVYVAVLAAQGALRPRGSANHLQKIAGQCNEMLEQMGNVENSNDDYTLRHVEVGVTTRVEQRFHEHGKSAVRDGGGQWGRKVGMARQFWAAVALVAQHRNVIVFRSLFELCSSSLRYFRSDMHPYVTKQELTTLYHQLETIVHENAPLDNMAIGCNDVLMYGSLTNLTDLDTLRLQLFSKETLGKYNVSIVLLFV